MRIISGKAGGRKLKSITTKKVRPTLDRVKEALFSIILPYFPRKKGLDLFAGFGSLGLEAVSRGVNDLTFIEKIPRFAKIINQNIEMCNFQSECTVHIDDVFSFLNNDKNKYDLVFMDPPYNKGYIKETLNLLLKNDLLLDGALIVTEHHKDEIIKDINRLKLIRDRNYSDTVIKVFIYN